MAVVQAVREPLVVLDADCLCAPNFRPGDAVFGQCDRACAEYAAVNQDKLALKPANLTFEQAAALPISALAALHALRDVGKVRPGQEVLINGASGGVGTLPFRSPSRLVRR